MEGPSIGLGYEGSYAMRQQTAMDKALVDVCNAYNEVCPTECKGSMNGVIIELRRDKTDDKGVLRHVVSRLYDGLAFGNW